MTLYALCPGAYTGKPMGHTGKTVKNRKSRGKNTVSNGPVEAEWFFSESLRVKIIGLSVKIFEDYIWNLNGTLLNENVFFIQGNFNL